MKNWLLLAKAAVLSLAIVLTPSCGQQGGGLPSINGVKGPIFNVIDGRVVLTMQFLNLQVDAGFKAPVPKTKNTFVELAPNVIDGGMMLQLYMDVEDLRSINLEAGLNCKLPDDRAIPGVPGGSLENCLRVDTELRDMSFFFHKQLFGLWLPFGFETAGISGYWNVKIKEKRVGMLGIVGNEESTGLKAGGVLLFNLGALKDKELNMLLELSKRNPHIKF